ncbi:MAG: hypothetical protein GYB66_07555 [Chloroflexi bacterium]|nr:hypothetical protein [Chloroflexota bacterium]
MSPLRVLDVAGTPFQMGYYHGLVYRDAIRAMARQRLQLCRDTNWVSAPLPFADILSLAEACEEEHHRYDADLMAELAGLSTATGLSLAELIIANGFTDFVDVLEPRGAGANCTTFMAGRGRTAGGFPLAGQTWDMNPGMSPYVLLMRAAPENAPAFITFTLTGCVGMIGMNAAGIGVCINNLASAHGQPGVTWPFVVRRILKQTNIGDAMGCVADARLAGGHNYLIFDAGGCGYNIEAMPHQLHIELVTDYVAHANRCLHPSTQAFERALSREEIRDSDTRQARAAHYLQGVDITSDVLMALTRDRSDGPDSVCVRRPEWDLETVGAVVMSPSTTELWAVAGSPLTNEYARFVLPSPSARRDAVA